MGSNVVTVNASGRGPDMPADEEKASDADAHEFAVSPASCPGSGR
jgi:hypothetical protein